MILDRFGTKYEKRYSKADIIKLFKKAGFKNIKISNRRPYWCAIVTNRFMCGITGFILNKESSLNYFNVLKKMTRDLKNRGPDDEGFWKNENNTEFLGHRRLSILELSKKGSQPMFSKNNRYIISYNGEVYNHKDLRQKLNKEFNCTWKQILIPKLF